jgi:hypothetical protein
MESMRGEREERGVGADADGQSHRRDHREAWRARELPDGVAEILKEGVHGGVGAGRLSPVRESPVPVAADH